jgi:DivIVA domain-containing protein
VRVIPPRSATGFTRPAGPADTPGPRPVIAVNARTMDLIERIENSKFSTTRLSAGYDEEEVDTFLDQLIAVLSHGGQPDQGELRNAQFATTRLRPGYVVQDVDSLLQEIAQASLF